MLMASTDTYKALFVVSDVSGGFKIMKSGSTSDKLLIGENNSYILGPEHKVINYLAPIISIYHAMVADDGTRTITAITDEVQKKSVLTMFLHSDNKFFQPSIPIVIYINDVKHYYCQIEKHLQEPYLLDLNLSYSDYDN